MNEFEVCEKQNEIIRMQSEIIDDLFRQLMQYVAIEEEEKDLEMMKRVSDLRREVQGIE